MFGLAIITASLLAFALGKSIQPNSLEPKIVGGRNASIEEYPYQLSLEVSGMHVCGASLIKPNIAITAAHCTNTRTPSVFKIRAGTTLKEEGGETANVLSVCQHPKFTEQTIDCDMSVLILDRSLPLTSNIQTIELQPKNLEVPVGSVGTVTGWGALQEGGPWPVNLQEVKVPRVSDDICWEVYSDLLTENMICFGYPEGGKSSCQRDSGGPIVVDGKQVGVVSFGIGCGRPNAPGVYAKISSVDVSDYIDECIANL